MGGGPAPYGPERPIYPKPKTYARSTLSRSSPHMSCTRFLGLQAPTQTLAPDETTLIHCILEETNHYLLFERGGNE
jgi:hypothetical protein